MSRGSKGQINPMDLLLVAMVFFIGVGLFLIADFLSSKDMIISKQTIYLSMEIDDSGSELVSFLGSTSEGMSHMRILGDTLASNHKDYIGNELKGLRDAESGLGNSLSFSLGTCIYEDTATHPKSLSWPAPSVMTVSSQPGLRIHPIHEACMCHTGVDIPGGGFSVKAAANGTVRYAGDVKGYGNTVIITHDDEWDGYESLYAHLDSMEVSSGQRIEKDEEIGISGNTGDSTGAHLHFELSKDGKLVDPCRFIGNPPGGCSVENKCASDEPDSRSYTAQIPLPGAQSGNLKKTAGLVK